MIKACHSINKDPNSLRNQYESIKEKYLKDKYIIATACFQIATQICVCEQRWFIKDPFRHQIQNEFHFFEKTDFNNNEDKIYF